MDNDFEAVIGLEVHTQLNTKTKIFCSCSNKFGVSPNTNICPLCLGMPGVLPVMNEEVIELAIKTCLLLDFTINKFNKMDRKNYFYPDLPKNYQISQFDLPIGINGKLNITSSKGSRDIHITRVHIEEDAGKLVHDGDISFVDYNRTGTPLLEIVSEPDIHTSEEAYLYLKKLKQILEYGNISDCNMEEGSLRCDANVSVRKKGETKLGTKAEVKNVNSFKFIQKAIDYEIQRQIALIKDGGKVIQETRLYDSNSGKTRTMRSKEEAHDYRYFPEPDLAPIVIEEEKIESIRKILPMTPDKLAEFFIKEYDIPEYDALLLTSEKQLADYFMECVKECNDAKLVSNWIMGEVIRELNAKSISISHFTLSPKKLGELLNILQSGKISGKIAKDIFSLMIEKGKTAKQIMEEENLTMISNESELEQIIKSVIESNPQSISDLKSGKGKALGFLVGQVMKATNGKADPKIVNELLKKVL